MALYLFHSKHQQSTFDKHHQIVHIIHHTIT